MNSKFVPEVFWPFNERMQARIREENRMNDPGDENDYRGDGDDGKVVIRVPVPGRLHGMNRPELEEFGGESICAEADRLVSGERQQDYGHPLDNYTAIAEAAKALEIDVYTPEGAALFMVLTKVAREVHREKRDNRVDMAGYAKVVDLIHEERERRGA